MGYLRYSLMTVVLALILMSFVLGGPWLWAGAALALLSTNLADEIAGSTRKVHAGLGAAMMNAYLIATLPFLIVLSGLYATYLSNFDPFGLIALMERAFGIDLAAHRAATSLSDLIGGTLSLGVICGSAGVNVAHELAHRVRSRTHVALSRWLLAFTCDTTFAIEHVFGHHRHVGTDRDPSTARRGESLFAFFIRSSLGQFRGAFEIEAHRLANRGLPPWSRHNRALRGQLMSALYLSLYIYAAGWTGAAGFFAVALIGKLHLEAISYIEHYGLVRVPGEKVAARHSWDCYRFVSSALLYNLTRHADHHLNAQKPYWTLEARKDAPLMPFGYMSMMLMAFFPPLWHRVMRPHLLHWDRAFASEAERALVRAREAAGSA